MPHLDPTAVAILLASFWALSCLFRCFKTGQIKIRRISIGNSATKQFDNPDEAIKELEAIQEQIKQSDKSGRRIFIIRRDKTTIAGNKPVEIKINNPEEEIKSTQIHFPTSVRWNVRRNPNARRIGPMQYFIFAIISGAAGILLLFAANYERQWALASINWPTTQGHMIESYSYLNLHLNNRQLVKYSYTVNNEQYTSTTLAFNSTWCQDIYDVSKRFPVNSTVTVHYSPDNPCRSCLEIGNVNILGQRLYGVVLCFAGALLFLFMCITNSQNQGKIANNSLVD